MSNVSIKLFFKSFLHSQPGTANAWIRFCKGDMRTDISYTYKYIPSCKILHGGIAGESLHSFRCAKESKSTPIPFLPTSCWAIRLSGVFDFRPDYLVVTPDLRLDSAGGSKAIRQCMGDPRDYDPSGHMYASRPSWIWNLHHRISIFGVCLSHPRFRRRAEVPHFNPAILIPAPDPRLCNRIYAQLLATDSMQGWRFQDILWASPKPWALPINKSHLSWYVDKFVPRYPIMYLLTLPISKKSHRLWC